MNKVFLIGNIGNDIEVKKTGEREWCRVSLAVNEYYGGENHTTWVTCFASGKNAEILGKYANKGDKIAVEGGLNVKEKDDQTLYSVNIHRLELLTPKKKPQEKKPQAADDDYPF